MLFFVAISLLGSTSCQTVRVLKTTENSEDFKDGSGAQLKHVEQIQLVDVSVCFRFFFFAHREDISCLINSHYKRKEIEILSVFHKVKMIFGIANHYIENDNVKLYWPSMRWHHVCLSYNNNSTTISIVGNGITLLEKKIDKKQISSDFLRNLFLMRTSKKDN